MRNLKKIAAAIAFAMILPVFSAIPLNATAETGESSLFDTVVLKSMTGEESADAYTQGESGMKLNITGKNASVTFGGDDVQQFGLFDDVIIDLRLKIEGSGYNGDLKLYKPEGDLIDYGFPMGEWNRVRYKTKVYEQNGKKIVRLDFYNGKGKTIEISDFKIEKAPEDKPILGGVKLYSMECTGLMEGYVLVTPEGKVIVIDGGNNAEVDALVKFLRTFTNKVDYWFITHFHSDHATALHVILQNYDIAIENLGYSFIESSVVKERSGDSDYWLCDAINEDVLEYPNKVKNVITPGYGDVYKVSETVSVKALNDSWFEKNNNYGNNSGIIYKVETPGEDILFLGDMGDRGDYYLQDDWARSEIESCTVIQMAHHGQNGVTDKFYAAIKDIKVCLYPAAQWIYDNDNGKGFNSANLKTLHTRDLMRERGVMEIIISAHGRKLLI